MKNLKPIIVSVIVALVLLVSIGISPTISPSYASRVSSNDWTYTGNLSDAHYKGTATLLQNGKVLVAGGIGISGVTASAELYDPATGTWSPTGSMNTARDEHTATLLPDGRVLVAGGRYDYEPAFSSAELYDPSTGIWSYTSSMDQVRTGQTATLLGNGKVLVTGGDGDASGYNQATSSELYDPESGSWSYTGSLNISRTCHSATLLTNGKVLVAGGYHMNNGNASAEIYDPSTGIWSLTGSMHEPRSWLTATLLPDGKVLVAGSEIFWNTVSSAEIYDPATGSWSYTGSMNDTRGNHTAVSLPDETVLVAGGLGIMGNSRSAEIYDPATGIWSYTGSMNDGRRWLNGIFLPTGKVLAVGGEGITTSELYDFPLSVNLIPSEQSLSVERGDTVRFVETLSNYTGITDTFNIELGNSLWPATLSDSAIGPMSNGEQITFTLDITIPLDADWGVLNAVLITATSNLSPTVYFDTAVLNSQMGLPPDLFLPMALQNFYKCSDFFDDFSDPESGWYTGEDNEGRVEYLNGEYSVLVKPENYYWILGAPACDQVNYSVEVDARWAGNSGASYGLVFGLQGDFEQFYSFEVNSDRQEYALYRYGLGGWTEIVPSTYVYRVINTGSQANHLKVTRNGDTITLEVNGTVLGTWFDNAITGATGSGLIVSSYSDLEDAEARFDNYKVTGLGSAASASIAGFDNEASEAQAPEGTYRQVYRQGSWR